MDRFMEEATKEAKIGIENHEGGPFGCIIVKDGKIVGRGHNQVLLNHDPTCHGEMMAIGDAGRTLKTHNLKGCTLYTTAAPCPMCKGAILWANISKVFYGCTTKDTESLGFRDDDLYERWHEYESNNFGEMLEHKECEKLFDEYKNTAHNLY